MLTVRSAATLLAAADSIETLAPLAAVVGCAAAPRALDAATRSALGLPDTASRVAVAAGAGALRALLVSTAAAGAAREVAARCAGSLAARSPDLLWIVLVAEPAAEGDGLAIAAWPGGGGSPRIAALAVRRTDVVDSDAETLVALAAAAPAPGDAAADVLAHARWLETLGRGSLTRRFYRALERVVGALGASLDPAAVPVERDRRDLALLYVSRLLFLSFLQAKGWLAGDRAFLRRSYDACLARGGAFHRRVLLPLFFGTLNTRRGARAPAARAFGDVPFLNGGLFARIPLERASRRVLFADDVLGIVFSELLDRYRFTAREDSRAWSEAAVDPEMLGRAFESLMASRERRTTGAFYTPQPLVERAVDGALSAVLRPHADDRTVTSLLGGAMRPPHALPVTLRGAVESLRVLDPACGSGAFLVALLERLASLRALLGDDRPLAEIRRDVLARSVFGVDVNPTAVWLCELRLWLSVVIESSETDARRVPPLPNLDRHVRVGDALAGGDFRDAGASRGGARLSQLRSRYVRASGPRKLVLAGALDREERLLARAQVERELATVAALRRSVLAAARGADLFGARRGATAAERSVLDALRGRARSLRASRRALDRGGALPFSFPVHFADALGAGGFDVVVGNPPWVRLHNIPPAARARFRATYDVAREPPWTGGLATDAAPRAFAGQTDLAALFVERSVRLTRAGGCVALLLPAKLWRSLAGAGVRRFIATHAALVALDDWSDAPALFDAAVYPSLVVMRKGAAAVPDEAREDCDALRLATSGAWGNADAHPRHAVADARGRPCTAPPVERCRVAVHTRHGATAWHAPSTRIAYDASAGAPWLLLPDAARLGFDAIRRAGAPLGESRFGQPILGVKCGVNDAFVVALDARETSSPLVTVRGGDREGLVERELLRPLIRGEGLVPWTPPARADRWIVWTHDDLTRRPLARLPRHAERWLAPWRSRLAARADARAGGRWWSLFRTEGARRDAWRVVWGDIGREPRAVVVALGSPLVPLNSCYVVRCPGAADAFALAALLNAPPVAAWLAALAEPARGGYVRYLAWTVARLPLPLAWEHARADLAALGERAASGDLPSAAELARAACDAYGIPDDAADALVAWSGRRS